MKKLYIVIFLCLFAALAFAAKPELPRDRTGMKLQGFAPDGRKDIALTVGHRTVDMTDDVKSKVYTPTACKFILQSTATRVSVVKNSLATNAVTEIVVNPSTPFITYSGCTNGELQRQ